MQWLAEKISDVTGFFSSSNVDGERFGSLKNWFKGTTGVVLILLIITFIIMFWWSREPDVFWVTSEIDDQPVVTGYSTTDTVIKVTDALLNKSGGFLSNDKMPPGVFLDNIPNFEYGALVSVRDLVKIMRNDYSRSQSQSTEDKDLAKAEPALNIDHTSWLIPRAEGEYQDAIKALTKYRERLADDNAQDGQFYARADNLREWLIVVEKRLGSLSARLSASVGQERVNTDLAGDKTASSSTPRPDSLAVKTPWMEIDDVFFEARGTAWALLHFLRAAEFDFADVLDDKNATVSLRQIIRELEASLDPIRSPVILNGGGYGFTANHSLVMASYLSRANSAVINLRELLDQG
ncbi:MAG: DUF2333 family protein [Gammaproteobacteria bacterium]|nr:DUF2333 family protein [Gammaproteobacteria bacterium]NNC98031.1 DUF2333 family protein [Gammaproteobacteria bacterium]NNM12737.1 DUF2333 family protein [Gammaproteobacteria bacterium]